MTRISRSGCYWLLSLLVLCAMAPFSSSQDMARFSSSNSTGGSSQPSHTSERIRITNVAHTPEILCNIFTDGGANKDVLCDRINSTIDYSDEQQELASLLLSCANQLTKLNFPGRGGIATDTLEKCMKAFQNNSYVCWLGNVANLGSIMRANLTGNKCKLESFYKVINDFNRGCDFGDHQKNAKAMLSGVDDSLIDWERIIQPVVACIIPRRLCNNTDFLATLDKLLNDDRKCTGFSEKTSGCCPYTNLCTCLSALGDTATMAGCSLDKMRCSSCVNDDDGIMCSKAHFKDCNFPGEIASVMAHIKQRNCSCETIPELWEVEVERCSNMPKTEQHVMALETIVGSSRAEERYYSQIVRVLQLYSGDKKPIMMYPTAAKLILRASIEDLTLDGLLDYVENFTNPKILALVRQTLAQLGITEDKGAKLNALFVSAGCPLLSGIGVKTLEEPGAIPLELAIALCDCSEQPAISAPAKIDALCEIIVSNVYYGGSKDKFGDFKDIMGTLCPRCLVYSLNMIPDWKKMILDDTQLKASVCDKVGSSIALTTEDLMDWAKYCTVTSGASGCSGVRPSLMAYQTSPPSPADLAACKDFFCSKICSLTSQELDTIRQALGKNHAQDVGCLTYLDDNISKQTSEQPIVGSNTITGSCPLRSRILKRAPKNIRQRRQVSSCTGECIDVEYDISLNISPPDVLDVTQIATCETTIVKCIMNNDLGEFRWDAEQARALLKLIRQSGTFDVAVENWSSGDLQILGFIGVGFTPEELNTLNGLSDAVYEIFGVAHGWSPQQRRVLARRYLRDRNLQPQDLTSVHLAKLNHIVCGLLPDEVRDILRESIVYSTTFLGDLRRCEIGVLIELAAHLKMHYGPVNEWVEDNFSEFGIILAGLRGEDLRSVGTDLSDHITVPFINHIPPGEFRKLSPKQTSLFTYVVAQAINRRGLCPWLSERHKQGNIQAACSNCTYLQPGATLFLLLAAMTAAIFSLMQV